MRVILHQATLLSIIWMNNQVKSQIAECQYDIYNSCDLKTSHQSFNEALTRIDGQHEVGRTDADIKYLENHYNHTLMSFSSIFCQKFPNLEDIIITNAELESIDEDSLSNCKNLRRLFLYSNKFQEFPEYLLIRNSKLTYLRINNNQLTTLPENFFLNLKMLEDLQLHENELNFLPGSLFRPLIKLQELHLYNNKIDSINTDWFVNLKNLKWLGLNSNQIREIPSKSFLNLENLERLWLHDNKIETLKPDSFNGLRNLESLQLQSNKIFDLPVEVFNPLKSLQSLSISKNKLTVIHSDSFGIHNRLDYLYLQDNQVNAIDEQIMDNTAVSNINMKNNNCSQLNLTNRSELKIKLKKCLESYKPRDRPQELTSKITESNTCGKTKSGHGNIIGGTQINSGDYPWIAALMTRAGQFFCGGTLVSSRKVVTAAHCIQEKKSHERLTPGDIMVLLGVHDLDNSFEIGRTSNAVYSINVHPDWNILTQAYDADIAVLVLEKEVTLNEYIQPICLPVPNSNIARIVSGSVVGYGKSEDETKQHENIPKIIATPIHNNDDCFKANEDLIFLSSGRTFCGGSGKGVGVCKGDSGSGLIVSDSSAYYLRGVVSSSLFNSYNGCDVDTYAIFTNVLKFVDWINGIPTDRFAARRKK